MHGAAAFRQDDGRGLHRPKPNHRPHTDSIFPSPGGWAMKSRGSDMDRSNLALNRRIFLRGMGGLALAAPFLSSINEAKGQTTIAPKRLVIFYTHNGCLTDKWFPTVQNGPLTAADLMSGTL